MTRKNGPTNDRPAGKGGGLALIGYRGTGKSTVGRLVAERVSRRFFDADVEIETRAGRSISEIFAESGEPAFRDWEEQTLASLTLEYPGSVIATGGGAIVRETNRDRLTAFGFIVWLTAPPDVLADRLASDHRTLPGRPALSSAGTLGEIAQILEVRTPLYRSLADATVDTSQCSVEEVVNAIIAGWAPSP
jgi:shikimate kinase